MITFGAISLVIQVLIIIAVLFGWIFSSQILKRIVKKSDVPFYGFMMLFTCVNTFKLLFLMFSTQDPKLFDAFAKTDMIMLGFTFIYFSPDIFYSVRKYRKKRGVDVW